MRVFVLWMLSMWRLSRAFRVVRVSSPVSVATKQYPMRIPFLLHPHEMRHASRVRTFASQATNTDESTLSHIGSTDTYEDFTRLAEEIRRHDELYYGGAKTELSDDEYDALVEREAHYCQEHPDHLLRYQEESGLGIQATRYGGRVGAINVQSTAQQTSEERQRHIKPMLSLTNVNSTPQLLQWLERIRDRLAKEDDDISEMTIVTEPKLDGLSLSLRYQQSNSVEDEYRLAWAATRGDGSEGQDVTHAVKSLQSIPQTMKSRHDVPTEVEVRGEVILPTSAFEALQANFSNARNAASGILLRKAKELDQEDRNLRSQLRFYAYDIVSNDEEGLVTDGIELRSRLTEWGFDVPQPFQISTLRVANDTELNETDISTMLTYYQDLERHRQGEKSNFDWGDFEMDGVVHKVSQLDLRALLGNTNRSPRWAVAHKFPSETALTSILGLEVQVGRTGALTPVAVLEPVDIGGVSVKRATLHNFGFLQQLMGDISIPIGTKVLVRRAGDVIPQVVQRVLDMDNATTTEMISLEAPTKCPACGSQTAVVETLANNTRNETQGQVVRCVGPSLSCPPRAVGALAHAFSRDALDVKGLSEARIQQLMDAGILRIPADLFKLASRENISETLLSNITELPGWGEKSAKNLAAVASKIATNGISLPRFIYSLGIRHAGQHSSKLIASTYGSSDTFLLAVEEAADSDNETAFSALVGSNETEGAKGIGPAQISSLVAFANEADSVKAARQLANAIPVHDEAIAIILTEPSEGKPWAGYKVVFTGTLPNGMSRKEAQELAKSLGAQSTPGSISKSVDVVVVGEKGGAKKLDQALKLRVRVMDASEFANLVETHIPIDNK